jgi:hypothetical protein
MTHAGTMQRPKTMQSAKRNAEESGKAEAVMRWGHAPSPLRGWRYTHPLTGESGAR